MAKLFISCFTTLFLFNIIFYLTGITASFLGFDNVLSLIITIGLIAVAISLIPFTYGASAVKWFLSIIVLAAILFSVSFNILTWNITLGVGLASNLMNLSIFSSNMHDPSFLGYLFFLMLGILGFIGGLDIVMGSGN